MYLDMKPRVDILNKRMDLLRELLDLLNTTVNNTHFVVLEKIVIWLIVLEVAVEIIWNVLIKDILGLY